MNGKSSGQRRMIKVSLLWQIFLPQTDSLHVYALTNTYKAYGDILQSTDYETKNCEDKVEKKEKKKLTSVYLMYLTTEQKLKMWFTDYKLQN